MTQIELVERGGCPLCGSHDASVHVAFREIPVNRCGRCGFLYSSKLMTEESMALYYRDNFGSKRHLQGQMVTARINAWAMKRLLDLKSTRSLLDVGTGYGFLLKEARDRFGIDGIGVEPSTQEAAHGREVLKLDIRNTTLSQSGLSKCSFDLVTAFEVIEHIPNPRGFIQEMIEFVRPGGYLLVMTDNFESGVVKALGHQFPKWIPHSHVSHFSPRPLEKLVSEAGLSVIGRLSYTPWELLARKHSQAFVRRQKSVEEAFDVSDALETEMKRTFRLYWLRRCLNRGWARFTCRRDLDGALMYMLGQREERALKAA